MTIPDSLSARRTELERTIEAHDKEAREHVECGKQHLSQAAIARAELHGIAQSIEAYSAAEVVPEPVAPLERTRRPLRKLVLDWIDRQEATSTDIIRAEFRLSPSRAAAVIGYWRDQGKITGDDTGWRLVRAEPEPLQLAAE